MKSLSHDELRELAPAFVMGTLTSVELADFNAAIADPATAAELAPELEAHRAAVEFLATGHAVMPPPSLAQRLGARIAHEQAVSMRLAETAEVAVPSSEIHGTDQGAPSVPRAVRVPPVHLHAAPRTRHSTPAWATAGIFGLAMAASLLFAVSLKSRIRGLEDNLHTQQLVIQRTAEQLANRDSTVNALTHAEKDLVLVRLASNVPVGPNMQVFWNQRTGEAVVLASGLAQIAANRTYCLWIIRNGKPEAVKLFNPDADGHRLLNAVALPVDARGIAAFAVTEEPAEGSPQPTMTPFLVGVVPAK